MKIVLRRNSASSFTD